MNTEQTIYEYITFSNDWTSTLQLLQGEASAVDLGTNLETSNPYENGMNTNNNRSIIE